MLTRWGYRAPNMWNELSRLSREMDRLFGETRAAPRTGVFPPINLFDDGERFVLQAEVPGMDPNNLEINATANTLSIRGERKLAEIGEKAGCHRRERGHGSFNRSITLPQEIDPNKVQATYKLGVLEIAMPKSEALKPKKIQVQA